MNRFLVNKSNLFESQFDTSDTSELEAGEVLFRIDKYALTTNNITYAVVGHRMKYWDFFPVDEQWGIVPVWGFAEVVESQNEAIAVGTRYYGYYPMSDYLKVKTGKVNPFGFTDISEHRKGLAPIYNFYTNTKMDPGYDQEKEDYMPIIKPLFATSFLNYHFLQESNFFEADQIAITSASSKTGLGLAYLLHQNKATDGKTVIGLTSKRNVDFVKQTGYYDQVIAYDDAIAQLPSKPTAIVDMAGNSDLLHSIYEAMGEQLKYISLIGLTDWQASKSSGKIPVAELFFAPTHAENKIKEWGNETFTLRLAKDLKAFTEDAAAWMELAYIDFNEATQELYLNMLNGKVNPSIGYIISIKN